MNKTLSEQRDWNKLLGFISEKKLTPIIGKEMYKFTEKDKLIPIEEYLSKQLLEWGGVTDQSGLTLNRAVDHLEYEKKIKDLDIKDELKSIVRNIDFDFPLLSEFLSIQDFSYYINTAVYNNVLEQNITKVRKQNASSINFSITEPFSDFDDLGKLNNPFVFNVFGSLLNTIDPALSEEDMLESTVSFMEKLQGTTNIKNALKSRNLLFIGCAYPDWMVRFILRLLSNEPMHDWGTKRTIIVVNDKSDLRNIQFDFLKNYDVMTYEGNTDDFVHELANQWKQKNPLAVKNKSVFLSYTRKDKEAVETLKKAIEGINNVSCWYDMHDLDPGDDFDTKIVKSIAEADLFIPLISANSLEHKDGYVQSEWYAGHNMDIVTKKNGNYLIPIVIDDTNPYDQSIPKYFSKLNISTVPGGNPEPEFLDKIKKTLNLI